MLVAAVIQADTDLPTGTSPGSPAKYVPSSYTSLKEALNQMLYLIAICIIKSNAWS
jgi:hypothetical protein